MSLRFLIFTACVIALGTSRAPANAASQVDTTTIELEEIVVSASRTSDRVTDLPGNITVLTGSALRSSPARTIDGVLQSLPGFGLFRRTSSEVAHPTTQGVSLRGIGASGASRSLVLLDGVPLNDPFGGWVQWGKVRRGSIDRIEVLRGATHAWGNYALGGVIAVESRRADGPRLRVESHGGNGRTGSVDLAATLTSGRTAVTVEGGAFHTGGYALLDPNRRGSIDGTAGSRNAGGRIALDQRMGTESRILLQAGGYDESRDNGTLLTGNGTRSGFVSGRFITPSGSSGQVSVTAFGQWQRFRSTFSSQAEDRNSESPALDQYRVPSAGIGASVTWRRLIQGRHLVSLGADSRYQSGETNERFFYSAGSFLRERMAGGVQRFHGAFANIAAAVSGNTVVSAGLRVDNWRTSSGFRLEREIGTGLTLLDTQSPDRAEWAFSPKLGVRVHATPSLDFYGSVYRTFRGPTLNELYRPFRVRNDITAANDLLGLETLDGIEAGCELERGSVGLSLGGFWNEVSGLVVNRTVGSGPGRLDPCGFVPAGGTCRQRDNAEGARMRGVEAEGSLSGNVWEATARYALTDSRFTEAPGDAGLGGKILPQVPRHRAVLSIGRRVERVVIDVRLRYVGSQYEDDANTIELGDFVTLDAAASFSYSEGITVTGRVENALDVVYPVGVSAGIETRGAPRRFTLGFRIEM